MDDDTETCLHSHSHYEAHISLIILLLFKIHIDFFHCISSTFTECLGNTVYKWGNIQLLALHFSEAYLELEVLTVILLHTTPFSSALRVFMIQCASAPEQCRVGTIAARKKLLGCVRELK